VDYFPKCKLDHLIRPTNLALHKEYQAIPPEDFELSKQLIAILLQIECIGALHDLHSQGFRDEHLPVKADPHDKQTMVPAGGNSEQKRFSSKHIKRGRLLQFFREQYFFLSPILKPTAEVVKLGSRYPLPIIYKGELLAHGNYGEVYSIKVHHSHLELDPKHPQVSHTEHMASAITKLTL
jgi:hypothetical protein